MVSYWLRHDPADAGVELDESGWAPTDGILAALGERGLPLDQAGLISLNLGTDKVRWEVDSERHRIRALHGHSVEVTQTEASLPPAVLFHGTATRFLPAIQEQGLLPMSRQKVHLAETESEAAKVGARHGAPVVLTINTPALVTAGAVFHRTAAGVWLTDPIPVEFIDFG